MRVQLKPLNKIKAALIVKQTVNLVPIVQVVVHASQVW